MNSGQIQVDHSHFAAAMVNIKAAFLLSEFDIPDLKIGLGAHSVGRIALFHPGDQFLNRFIVQA